MSRKICLFVLLCFCSAVLVFGQETQGSSGTGNQQSDASGSQAPAGQTAGQDAGAQPAGQGQTDGQEASAESGDQNTEALDAVTVTGTRSEKRLSESSVTTEIIDAREIAESNASTVVDVLEDYGLTYTGNAMGDYIQLQGLGEGRVLILVDGRKVVGRIAQRINGDTLPLSNVERIEIVRGPQSAMYGSDGMGGVINIVTKKPADKVSFSASATNQMLFSYDDPDTTKTPGAFDYANPVREQVVDLALGLPIGPLRTSLTTQLARGSAYLNETNNYSVLPEYLRGKFGLELGLSPGDALDLTLGGDLMLLQSDDITSTGILHNGQVDYSRNRQTPTRAEAYLGAVYYPGDTSSISLRVYDVFYQRNKDSYSAITQEWISGQNYENENLAQAELYGIFDLAPFNTLTLGIEAAIDSMNKYNLATADHSAILDKQALVAQDEFHQDGLYSLIVGARVERNSNYGFSFAPKFSGMVYLAKDFRILLGLGTGYRAPDFNDLYLVKDDDPSHPVIYGNDQLLPEYSVGGNLGLEFSPQNASFRLNVFHNELFDEIVYALLPDLDPLGRAVYKNENVNRTFRFGFDAEARVSFLKYLNLTVAYSFLYAYDRNAGAELYIQPMHTGRAKFGVKVPEAGFDASLSGRIFSPLIPDDPAYPVRFVMDLYLAKDLDKNFELYLSIDNLLGYVNRLLGPYVAQQVSLGLRINT